MKRSTQRSPQAGFTLIEILVSLAVMVVVLGGLLAILQVNSRIAKAQINVAEMQQALRVAQADIIRDVRMAGRGGLPAFRPASATPAYPGMLMPDGPAIAVANDVPADTTIGGDDDASVLPGSDVLTVRGVLTTTLYQVERTSDGRVGTTGQDSIIVRNHSPTGVPQDLQALKDAIAANRPEALLLISAVDDQIQVVVELTGGTDNDTSVELEFDTGGTHGANYLRLSPKGQYPPELTAVTAVGILEEYRYYVRDVEPAPRLSRARLYPGTDEAYADNPANLTVDVADNVLDLQLALGIDQNGDEIVVDNGDDADDWLFNAAGDSPPNTADWNGAASSLYYLRITTLARTDRLDPDHVSPPIQSIEDHVYDEPEAPADEDRLERRYRRRLLETVVDLRNLT